MRHNLLRKKHRLNFTLQLVRKISSGTALAGTEACPHPLDVIELGLQATRKDNEVLAGSSFREDNLFDLSGLMSMLPISCKLYSYIYSANATNAVIPRSL
jgi:hypothetical protein